MIEQNKVALNKLSTGVPGLDGTGRRPAGVLVQHHRGGARDRQDHPRAPDRVRQRFAGAARPVLHRARRAGLQDAALPAAVPLLRPGQVEHRVRFINLSQIVLEKIWTRSWTRSSRRSRRPAPASSWWTRSARWCAKSQSGPASECELQGFVQRLALHLTSWQATTFLIGEYAEEEIRDNPVFTVADGLFWLYQSVERNSIVRKLQVMKLRGQASVPGLHTFRITDDGLQVFPRTFGLTGRDRKAPAMRAPLHGHRRTGRDAGRRHPARATACWSRGRPGPGSRCWRPSSSPRASARGRPASSPSSRSARRSTPGGPPTSAWTWRRRGRKASSTSSTSAPSTFRR